MKKQYLDDIRELLEEKNFEKKDIEDIIADYAQLYDDMVAGGHSDEETMNKLGTPRSIVEELSSERRQTLVKQPMKGRKLIALSPFVATILFFVLGFAYNLWHLSWMAFLLIPVTAIVVEGLNKRWKRHFLTPLMPFVSVLVYMALGFGLGMWHPGWLVFLSIPVVAILESRQRNILSLLTALSPFMAILAFFILGEFGLWQPGWLVFLAIPMIGILNGKNIGKIIVFELSFVIAIGLYLYIGYVMGEWTLAALSFLIPVVYGILSGDIQIRIFQGDWFTKIVVILTIAAYIAAGILFPSTWPWLWVIFFLVPVQAIVRKGGKENILVAVMPFVATTIFYLVGFFVPGAFAYSWLAFLLIPMAAILKDK